MRSTLGASLLTLLALAPAAALSLGRGVEGERWADK